MPSAAMSETQACRPDDNLVYIQPLSPVCGAFTVCQLYVDVDGKGFQLEEAYETKPQPAVLAFTAQKRIREFQDQVSTEEKKASAQNRGFQSDDDDDFDWDTINDDLAEGEEPFIEPPMPSEEEINSRLRDD